MSEYSWSLGSQRISLGDTKILDLRNSVAFGALGPKITSALYLSEISASVLRRSDGYFYRLNNITVAASGSATTSIQIRSGSLFYRTDVVVSVGQSKIFIPDWEIRSAIPEIPYRGTITLYIDELSGGLVTNTSELLIDLSTGAASGLTILNSVALPSSGSSVSDSVQIRTKALDPQEDGIDTGLLSLTYTISLKVLSASSMTVSASCSRSAVKDLPVRFEYGGFAIDSNSVPGISNEYTASAEFNVSVPAATILRIIPYTSMSRSDYYSVVEVSLLNLPGSNPVLTCETLATIIGSTVSDIDATSATELDASSASTYYAARILPAPQYVKKVRFRSIDNSVQKELSSSSYSVFSGDNRYLSINFFELRGLVLSSSNAIGSNNSYSLAGYIDFFSDSVSYASSPLISLVVPRVTSTVTHIRTVGIDRNGSDTGVIPICDAQRARIQFRLNAALSSSAVYLSHNLTVQMNGVYTSGASITNVSVGSTGIVMSCTTANTIPGTTSFIVHISGTVAYRDGSVDGELSVDSDLTISGTAYHRPEISAASVTKQSSGSSSADISISASITSISGNSWSAYYQYYNISTPTVKIPASPVQFASGKSSDSTATATVSGLTPSTTYVFILSIVDEILDTNDKVAKLITLPGSQVILDVARNGKAIAFGTYATENSTGLVDMGWPCRFKQGINSVFIEYTENLSLIKTSGFYRGNTSSGRNTDLPTTITGDWSMFVMGAGTNGCTQTIIGAQGATVLMFVRYVAADNTATPWKSV